VKLDSSIIAEYGRVHEHALTKTEAALQTYLQGAYAGMLEHRAAPASTSSACARSMLLIPRSSAENTRQIHRQCDGLGHLVVTVRRQRKNRRRAIQTGIGQWRDTGARTSRTMGYPYSHFATQSANFENLFAGLSAILAYAATAGITDRFTLIVMSESAVAPSSMQTEGRTTGLILRFCFGAREFA